MHSWQPFHWQSWDGPIKPTLDSNCSPRAFLLHLLLKGLSSCNNEGHRPTKTTQAKEAGSYLPSDF